MKAAISIKNVLSDVESHLEPDFNEKKFNALNHRVRNVYISYKLNTQNHNTKQIACFLVLLFSCSVSTPALNTFSIPFPQS